MKTLLAIGVVFSSLLSPPPSRAQEDPKDPPQAISGDSLHPPVPGGGVDLTAAANRGAFSVNSKTDSIGNVPVGSTKTDTVTVTNTGKATLTISSVRSSNARFTVSPVNASIPVNANKKFGITFAPAAAGAQTSFIVFTHDGPTSPDTVTASGTGTAPAFSVNRKNVAFGSVVIATGKPDSVSVTNTGTAALVISSVTSTNARFTVNPTGGTIQPGGTSTFRMTFTPALNGVQNGNIVFVHNALTARDTVAVSGTGTGFSVNLRSVAFVSVPVAVPTRDSIIVTNAGPTTLTISGVTSSNGAFTVNPAGASIAAAASAKFYITFTPANTTAQAGNVVFTHNASSSPDTVAVSGTGVLPGFSLSRKTVPFGTVALGGSKLDSLVVTNVGAVALVIGSVTSTNGAFTVNPLNATLQPAQARTFYITFTPANTTAQTGNVVFTHNGSSSPDTVAVSGTGGTGGFSVTRRAVPFGTVALGGSKLDSVLVTNIGGVALVIGSVTSSNGAFAVNPVNATLQPSQSRTFYITFTPANTTAQTGNVVFIHNGSSSPDTVTVSGTGGAGGFTVTRRSVQFGTVALGGSKLDSVLVTNIAGVALVIGSVTSSNGAFTVNPPNAAIQPSQARTFYITFTPANTAAQTGSLVFVHNGSSSPDTVTVSGTGGSGGFTVTRRSVPFGTVALGGSKLDSVLVTNVGAVTLVIGSVTSSNGAFSVNPVNATLQPSQSRTFYITFTPANTNLQTGNVVFLHTGSSSPDTVALSGTGGTGGFTVTRRFVPFGTVTLGGGKLDSVVVTNVGAVTLVIGSVTSTNTAFRFNPPNATLQPSQAWTFYITFTPTNTNPQTGNVVFSHTGPSSPDTVVVSGTGATGGFTVTRRSVPFGTVTLGGSKPDSVLVTNNGVVALVIGSVTSSNGAFTVNPANATLQPVQARTFYITFTPTTANPQAGNVVFLHNGSSSPDTVAVSGTGIATLSAPVLISPASGSTGQAPSVALSWSSVNGATGYWLEMATDPSFTMIVINDPTLASTGRQVNGLPQNTQYYWRVSTLNDAGSGLFSPAWTLTTLPSGVVSGTISFSGDLSSTSYRMFGLPGVGTRKVGDILSGTQNVDWRILRDTGKDTTYPTYYEDLNAGSVLKTGEAYWLLQRKDLNISRTDSLPPIAPDGTYSIALHSGWNMISDPFTTSVQRTAVIAANGLPAGTLFWEQIGTTRTSSGTTLEPFKGYYYDNDILSLALLKIPYSFGTTVARLAKAPVVDWRAELVFDSDINTDRDNYIGIAPSVGTGRNELDQHESPLSFDQGFLYFVRPEWDPVHPRFATDMRAGLGAGQTWDFEVWNPRIGPGKITLNGLEGIPAGDQVVLVNALNTSPVDMRRSNVYTYQSSSTKMQFKLIVGTKEYANGEISKLVPQVYELAQNYPNPFNPSTTISYMIPAGTYVRLEILSLIGQRVRVLDEGYRAAATYSVIWDGKDENRQTVSSGIYFCRLVAGGNAVRTRKLVLMR